MSGNLVRVRAGDSALPNAATFHGSLMRPRCHRRAYAAGPVPANMLANHSDDRPDNRENRGGGLDGPWPAVFSDCRGFPT